MTIVPDMPIRETVGLRELRQNASVILERVVATGNSIVVTSRGHEKVIISPVRKSRLQQLIDSGEATSEDSSFKASDWEGYWRLLADSDASQEQSVLDALLQIREEERY